MGCGSSVEGNERRGELVMSRRATTIVPPAMPPHESAKGCKDSAVLSVAVSADNKPTSSIISDANNSTNEDTKKLAKQEVSQVDSPSTSNTPMKQVTSATLAPASLTTRSEPVAKQPSHAKSNNNSDSDSNNSSGGSRSPSRSNCGSDMVIEDRSGSLGPRVLSSLDSTGAHERKNSPHNDTSREFLWSFIDTQLHSPRQKSATASGRRASASHPREASPTPLNNNNNNNNNDANAGGSQHALPGAPLLPPPASTMPAVDSDKNESGAAFDDVQPLALHATDAAIAATGGGNDDNTVKPASSPLKDARRVFDFDVMDDRVGGGYSIMYSSDGDNDEAGLGEAGFVKVEAVSTLGSQMSAALDVEDEGTTRLATFSAKPRTCMKCGSGAIAYVNAPMSTRPTQRGATNSDNSLKGDAGAEAGGSLLFGDAYDAHEEDEEEYYMCESCYFADLGAHKMIPLHETRCNTSRTMGSSMVSVLTVTEGGASSLFYNPCSVCHRVIDDTEVVHRCEKCDFIVCDNCFTTRTVQHEDELKRFQRRQNDSVHETSIISKTHDSEGNKVINNYTVVRLLGTGSYAKVKLVKHIVTHELFALKILRRQRSAASSLTRSRPLSRHGGEDDLLREVAVMKFIHHPNIVQLKEVIEDVEAMKIYIIMEYCEHGPIHVYGDPPLPLELVRRYGCDILKALLHLHSEFLYHRDVKPANCLVDGKGVAKLADFGSCTSRIRSNLTEGTLAYSAPEQIRGEEVAGEVVDSWAFAITLYQASFGHLPYAIDTIRDIHDAVAGPAPLEIPRQGCDPCLVDLLGRMLQKDLAHRLLLREAATHAFFDAQRDVQLTTSLLSTEPSELTEQRSTELYYKAIRAVLRGNNLKDCFHGVHSIRRMRRRLRSNHGFHTPLSRHVSGIGRRPASGGFGPVRVIPRQWISEWGGTMEQPAATTTMGVGENFLASVHSTAADAPVITSAMNPPNERGPTPHGRPRSRRRDGGRTSSRGSGEDGDVGEDADDETENGSSNNNHNNDRRRPSFTKELDDKVEPHNGVVLQQQQKLASMIVRRLSDTAHVATPVIQSPPYTEAGAPLPNTTTAVVMGPRREGMPLVSSLMSHQSNRTRGLSNGGGDTNSMPNVRVASATMDCDIDEAGTITADVLRLSRVTMSEPPASVQRYAPTAKRLVFAHNGLRSLGAMDFASFALLKDIAIVSNGLTTFPEAVLAAPRLLRLDLSGNRIANIPPSLRRARFLERLDLYNNEIRHVVAVLEQRRHLTSSEGGAAVVVSEGAESTSQMSVVSVLAAPCLRHVRLNENPLQSLPEALNTTTATSLELVLDANPVLMDQWSAVVERGQSGPVVVVWDDYFPVRVPHTPCLVWVATSYLNVYHIHTLETCAARHLVLFHAADRRFPCGAFTAAQLASYFVSSQSSPSEATNATEQNSLGEERRSNGTSEEMNGSSSHRSHNKAAFATRSLSSLPVIVSPEAAHYVKSYFFVSEDEEDKLGGYCALYRYLMNILPTGEGVMLFISNATTVRATRETTTAALCAVLKKIAGDTETLRQRFDYVLAAMRSLYE